MFKAILKRFSGSHYRKFLKKAKPIVARINAFEHEYQSLSTEELKGKTKIFQERYQDSWAKAMERLGPKAKPEQTQKARQDILDALLPEAFAVVKNAARRLCGTKITYAGTQGTWEMIPYDVQLIGGIALHTRSIAEMATGEGKTLVATLPLYLNALTGLNCQLVTVNEYLAERDAEWMGHLYKFLGLSVGVVKSFQSPEEKQAAYESNITYATASELGFDYLRDNGMATEAAQQSQREHYFCIVDEVDSILVDEARTPLIISGKANDEETPPFAELKNPIERIFKAQAQLCNTLANKAAENIKNEAIDIHREGLTQLYQVKCGMPRNRTFLRLMEQGRLRSLFDKFETELRADFNKKRLYHLKEELYYTIDERQQQADLTEKGRQAIRPKEPETFMLPDLTTQFIEIEADPKLDEAAKNKKKTEAEEQLNTRSRIIHTVSQLLKAYSLYERDKDYVVQNNEAIIVDENTGRMMAGRRWSDGLHQAVEVKESIPIQPETKTYATITLQNYFRLYEKLAGMTGTAETEAQEFFEIYNLRVMVIPTHKPCVRLDHNDSIYKTRREKYNAVLAEIEAAHEQQQPILVGTASVEASELLSRMLKARKISHQVLNAKQHQREAQIIAQAGEPSAVTIATNMAGRGTDIKLGEKVQSLGGLFVIGTDRHESRRIDRQLRGRCARQGDPGASKFFVSLEDDLMRLFANAGPLARALQSSFQENESLQHPLLNRSIQGAQKRVEQQNYSMRKHLLQYDDVLNRQREVIYGLRNEALHHPEPKVILFEVISDCLNAKIDPMFSGPTQPEPAAQEAFLLWLNASFPLHLEPDALPFDSPKKLGETIRKHIQESYAKKESKEDAESLSQLNRYIIVQAIDELWQEHLTQIDDLRQAVGLHGYAQKDPLVEYKNEAFGIFETLMDTIHEQISRQAFRVATHPEAFAAMVASLAGKETQLTGPQNAPKLQVMPASMAENRDPDRVAQPIIAQPKIKRNASVVIRRGPETKTLKFKKAEKLIQNEGWELVEAPKTKLNEL